MNEEFYIAIVCEIFNGYSILPCGDDNVYVSHPTLLDQQSLDTYYQKYYSRAIKKGVPAYEDSLKFHKEEGTWTDHDEALIAASKDELDRLQITRNSLPLQSQRESIQKRIGEVNKEISAKEVSKLEIIGVTAENYATTRAQEYLLYACLFQDAGLTQPKYSKEEFDDLEHNEVIALHQLRRDLQERISDTNIKHACLRPFFSLYLPLCENPPEFYGNPVTQLSVLQLKLAAYGRMFHSIFQYTDNIPDNLREDPDKLMAYSEAQRNKDSGKPLLKEDAAGSTVFGATDDDMKDLRSQPGSVSLTDVMEEKGGKLNMEDLMKLSGD